MLESSEFLTASFGRPGYQEPQPIPGHGPHHYGFYLYSLNRAIRPGREPKNPRKLIAEVAGHITGRAQLVGTYEQ